jgi:hypothetical protein
MLEISQRLEELEQHAQAQRMAELRTLRQERARRLQMDGMLMAVPPVSPARAGAGFAGVAGC